ncbi:MAG: hypothetical protein U9O56_08850 [Campylobacterota bacterium]|nr:hypothetical protein [Campylobacterota bacterium]
MVRSVLLLSLFSILFTACNQSATSVFKKDPIYAQNIQYTKLMKIVDANKTIKEILNITYLNSVDTKRYNKNQNFLVGIYSNNENNITNGVLTINKIKSIDKIKVSKDDDIYKNIAFKNNWADYYIYIFPNDNNEKLVVNYTVDDISSSITFETEY